MIIECICGCTFGFVFSDRAKLKGEFQQSCPSCGQVFKGTIETNTSSKGNVTTNGQ